MVGWKPDEDHRLRKDTVATRVSEVATDALGFTRHPGLPLVAASQVVTRTSPITPHLDSIAHGAAHTDASCRPTETASCWWRVSVVLATKRRRQQIAL